MHKSNITGLAHIGIFVKDMQSSIAFYQKLGFALDKEEQVSVRLAFLSAGNCLIELIEQTPDFTPRAAGQIDHIAVTVEDIDDAVADAKSNGIDIDTTAISFAPILGGIRNVFFEGPDGERLEFFEYCGEIKEQ